MLRNFVFVSVVVVLVLVTMKLTGCKKPAPATDAKPAPAMVVPAVDATPAKDAVPADKDTKETPCAPECEGSCSKAADAE